MRLYTIRRKSDGKFYVSAQGHYAIRTGKPEYQFSTTPSQFLKTVDGVAGNLRKLCSEPYFDTVRPKGLSKNITNWKELSWRNFDASKLAWYEVIITDVIIMDSKSTPAQDFIQIEALERTPLTRKERHGIEVK